MDTIFLNNKIVLQGKVATELEYSHSMYGESFYTFSLDVVRLSDSKDTLNITVSERLLLNLKLDIGTNVVIDGQLRFIINLLMEAID